MSCVTGDHAAARGDGMRGNLVVAMGGGPDGCGKSGRGDDRRGQQQADRKNRSAARDHSKPRVNDKSNISLPDPNGEEK